MFTAKQFGKTQEEKYGKLITRAMKFYVY